MFYRIVLAINVPTYSTMFGINIGKILVTYPSPKPPDKTSVVTLTTGEYGWSMDFDTSQGIVAVEYGRVLEYPKKRNKISDHEKARSLQINRVRIGK